MDKLPTYKRDISLVTFEDVDSGLNHNPDLSRLKALNIFKPVLVVNANEYELLINGKSVQVGAPEDTLRVGLLSNIKLTCNGKSVRGTVCLEDNGRIYPE
jgi:hypothetical protein